VPQRLPHRGEAQGVRTPGRAGAVRRPARCRLILRGKDLEHAWVNYPTEPALTLGTKIDKALAKAGYKPEKPKA
jgi:hypothetical protein